MKLKITQFKRLVFVVVCMININLFAQNYVPFSGPGRLTPIPFNESLKGDMLLIGNNILNRSTSSNGPNVPYNGTDINDNLNMQYVDIDGDPSTFNSSTADLTIPVANSGCYVIKYAALYWAGLYNEGNIDDEVDRSRLGNVKFKLPGGNYTDITGAVIYDTYPTGLNQKYSYVASYDVTTLLQGLTDASGTYGVANVQCGLGVKTSGGWSLFVVYEDPLSTAKNITLFDGFSSIQGTTSLDIPISGFNSIPVGPVRAKLAFAALEGDNGISGDRLRINGTSMSIPTRLASNFFNSTINDINGAYTTRNLNSSNTLGYDSGIINIPNPGNAVIANNATSANVQLQTSGDAYVYYLNAFAVEIIQPQINLIKIVRDLADNDIGNTTVSLGQEIFYELDFQNIGNDGATGFTIKDQLPLNVTFLPADLEVPPGVTYTFDPVTNEIIFTIPDNLVTESGANYLIRIKVRVAETCYDLRDACSNEIRNQAYKTYSSINSGNIVENEEPSASGINSCLILSPGTTNFLADIDDCVFEREEVLCGNSVTLTAGNGYVSYQWHSGSPPTAANAIAGATNQSYTVTGTGTYSVVNTAPAPCLSITETFNVIDFNGVVPNPVIPYADQVDVCPNDDSDLPKIYLCGETDSQLIETNILNATSIIWEVLSTPSTCTDPTPSTNCPNTTCPDSAWSQVGTGSNFNAVDAGEYRVRIVFQNGCFRTYYFNVYKNLFTPTATSTDIICNTPGTITVNGVPNGYEFSLDGTNWQSGNLFTINTAGAYTVYIRQIGGGVGNCIFDIPNIQILNRDFNVDVIVNDALCNGGQGSIRVQINNVDPQYTYQLSQGGTPINNVGPINANDYTFPNLPAGTYTVNISTTDGCTYLETVTISDPPLLTLTGAVTIPLTCTDGEITVYPVGGTPPYTYGINNDPGTIYSLPNFVITTPGTYTFTVTDSNNCTATTDVIIDNIPQPVYTVSQIDVLCYGESTGQIEFNVTNTNGYTLEYSIDNGVTFGTNPVFSNLPAGTYETIVQYSLGGTICTTTVETIVINQPDTALTASAGVSELAGCGPNGEGKVRITNPQGGVPGYEYSFDGGTTWVTSNEAYLLPGTYSVCIRDTNNCTFCTSVTIDPAPQDPTISVEDPDFNCTGTATSTVTVSSGSTNFSYTYLLDGVVNTNVPENVFVDVPCGDHEITVQYRSLSVPTYSNLLFEDFGRGDNTTSPGINPAYCFERQVAATQCNGSIQINDGDYAVTKRIDPRFGTWADPSDHTSNGTDPEGRFLCVNIGGTAGVGGILYSKPITDIIPNQPVQVSLWAMNLIRSSSSTLGDPQLTIQLIADLGTPSEVIVATTPTASPIIVPKSNQWESYSLALNPGSYTSLSFVIRSYSTVINGNDVVIDDINVFQEPIACITEVKYPIHIDCNQAFSAQITSSSDVSCNGATDGQITIAAQNFELPYGFDYSIDGGASWTNSTTSPVTITGLSANTYNIEIRFDDTAGTCSFPFTQVISEPDSLLADAVLTSPATCLVGGVITASASGGTPNYQYELQNSTGTVLVPFQVNNVFSNLTPGDYIVVVRDVLNCTDPIDVAINIPVPTPPTAVVDASSDLCYDGTNAATIVVTASGGVSPYQYSLNGGTYQNGNTFSGLTPGNYTITVRDSYGCEVTMSTVTIAPQLIANAVLTNGLDCTASPDADIDVTINGGSAPYTYQVTFNTAFDPTINNITGNTFTYSTANAGTYQFTITDAIGCTVTTSVITVNPLPVLNPPVVAQTGFNLCNGDTNGAISVTPSGGQAPYIIDIVNTTTSVSYGAQTTGLTAGDYTITVTDANSCIETVTITLTEPDPVDFTFTKTDIQCGAVGTAPGTINIINVTGGTSPFTYTISNSTGTYTDTYNAVSNEDHIFNILNFGIYTISVVDANGCQLVENNITIASPPNNLNINVSQAITDCTVGGTIEVCVDPAVAGGPYHFAIYEDLSPNNPPYATYPGPQYQPADGGATGLCATFTGLMPGVTYSFIVYDEATNCYYFETATEPVPTLSTITSTITPNNVTCTGAADGSVSFVISNYSGTSVSYQVYLALNNTPVSAVGTSTGTGTPITVNDFGVLPPGEYFVLFTENDGPNAACSQTSINFTISESPVLLSLTASVTKNDNCNPNAGQITVTGSNGTPPYTYQVVPAGSPAPTVWPGQTSNVFNVEGGSYDVYIMDAYGCIQPSTNIFVPTDTTPNIDLDIDAATLCNINEGNYSIIATRDNTVGVGPFTYSVDGAAFTTYTENASFSFTLTGLNSGTHTVIIKDSNGCTETETITIYPPLNGTITTTIDAVANCGVSDGIITVNASGGSDASNYVYTITPNIAPISQLGNVFSNVPAGNYTVTVTDNITGCSIDKSVILDMPTVPVFDTTVTNATCNLGTDGTITVNLTGSNPDPVYMYEITSPIVVAPQTSNVFTGLSAGNYTVVVTSGRNCVTTEIVTVGEATAINIPTVTVTEFGCNSGSNTVNNATIVVNGVNGGSGTYINYEFLDSSNNILQTGTSNTYIESNILGGTYTINVYDNNGCIGTTTAVINPFIAISNPRVTVTTPITCTNPEDITINIDTTGGTPATLVYTVVGLSTGSTYNVSQTNNPNFTGLTIGNYQITVENATTGCSVQTIHYVFDPNTFIVNAVVNNNVTCFDGADGSIDITFIDQNTTPTDDAGSFDYDIIDTATGLSVSSGTSPDAGPFTVDNLPSGVYQLQAVLNQNPSCPVTTNFTITQPIETLSITTSSTPISCIPGSDGSISAVGNNGWGAPYEYQLESGGSVIVAWSSVNNFTGLGAGTYTVSVRDNIGCEVSSSNIILDVPTPIDATINASTTFLPCRGDNDATITITNVTGGYGSGYLFVLNNITTGTSSAPQTSNVFTNLGAGEYNVTITDSFNCEFPTASVIIDEPNDDVMASLAMTVDPTCDQGATLELTAIGGTAPYAYSTTPGGPYIPFTGTMVFNNVASGTYSYYVVDANDCFEDFASIIVEPVIPVSVTVDTTQTVILCNGDTTSVTATAVDGLGNYVYTLLPATAGVVQSSPGVFINVPAGTYTVHVDSGDCDGDSESFTITEPTPMEMESTIIHPTCASLPNDGSVEIIVTGGTGVIQFSISSAPNETVNSGIFNDLTPGNYTVYIQDQNGCQLPPFNFDITAPPTFELVDAPDVINELCLGDGGSVSFSVQGGTPSPVFGYEATNGSTTLTSSTGDFTFDNLSYGYYEFIVTDGTGVCTVDFAIDLEPGQDIQPGVEFDNSCVNDSPNVNVLITFNEDIPIGDLTFDLDGDTQLGNNLFVNVADGNHTATVTHNDGCVKQISFNVTISSSPVLTLAQSGLNQFTMSTQGGTAPYSYNVNGQDVGSNTTYLVNQTGLYTVIVTDANGCTDVDTIQMTFYDVEIPDYFTPDGDGTNDGWTPNYLDHYPKAVTYVFDRYSRKIITLRPGQSWNGTYNGNELPSGDYWYVLKLNGENDAREFVGNFTLYR
ncbi:T9SS type B sorting domain-containing protein [Flavobacterium sp. 316]|uniref:T9SS type B sorting domain-containing protein n=1 Tax=Flavobacterium sp. 316 TaxID=1603293 RepID=UPI0009E19901|nr:T9SS type B sorting domain-containing protein [Flavobacterium sp. 316]